MLHTVGTYNMSFAGDAGLDPRREKVFESEGAFHLSNESGNPKQYWLNALEVVKHFWANEPNASVMGLQEINKTAAGTESGSYAIELAVKAINPALTVITEEVVVNPFVKPALTLVWDSSKLGTEADRKIEDLDYTPGEESEEITKPNGSKARKSGRQQGRPILMVLTTNGYLLVDLHAPNHAELSAKNLMDLRQAIQNKISSFIGDKSVSSDKIFIMGDFNDRYDALNKVYLKLREEDIELSYQGRAPLSCCHNWDSSCSDSRFEPLQINGRTKVGTCGMPKDGRKYALAGPGERFVMGDEGNLGNYRYYGDKVFGATPSSDIMVYRPDVFKKAASQESDHEMVVATFTTAGSVGGRRKATRKNSRKSSKKSRVNRR